MPASHADCGIQQEVFNQSLTTNAEEFSALSATQQYPPPELQMAYYHLIVMFITLSMSIILSMLTTFGIDIVDDIVNIVR